MEIRSKEEKRERKERKREEKRERKERKREEKRKEKERKFQESMERNDRSIIGSDISLLQIGVVFLAVVSFFTTANGMRTYIFTDDAFVAYAASGAIQSILLALSMNLPGYLSGISKRFHAWWGRALLRSMIILLTFVTISCSSWFSYVYIAAVLHEDSWEIDSELLVQQTYREELYDASEYANLYRVYLEEEIGEKILLLENQANALSKEGADFGIEDWTAERDAYVQEGGTTVSGYMATVIAAMEAAMDEDSGKEARDFAAAAVADAKESIAARIESNQANRDTQNENITNYQNQIAELTRRINNAAEGVDTTGLYASINRYTQNIDQATQRLLDLDTEDLQLDRALDRLSFYESCLGLNSSTSAISIRSELLMLQAEIFQQEVDVKGLLDMATNIFENLRNAAHSSESKDALDSEQQLAYTSLLIQMNQLIRNLKDYAGMKEIEAGLEALIAELSEIGDGAEADGSAGGHQKDGDSWKEEWRERFEELKAQISAMPTYSGSGEREDGAIGILSESQADILRSYDRNESGKKLDDILRRYIAVHNAVYAGVIYLQSPYRSLAIFALVLAYSFDLSGFVFGFVIQGRQGRGIRKGKGGNEDDTAMPPASAEVPGPGWSILETGERYLVLPGDYECRDGEYFYRVFRDGILEQWHVQDEAPYKKGIYIQERDAAKGRLAVPEQETTLGGFIQEMLFSGQPDGPRDGIYKECQLFFEEGSLYFICSGEKRFIASIDEYVPIHSYHPGKGENQTMPAKGLFKNRLLAETAVVALNVKGTRVSAVYVIEKDDVKDVVADGEDDSLISREEVVDSEEGA